MSAHAPGPWKLVDWASCDQHGAIEACGFQVVDAQGHMVSACILEGSSDEEESSARLIAAAPDLLAAQTMGAQLNTPDFMDWIAGRLIHIHHENPNVDFIHSLRERAQAGRAAIAKATTGAQP